MTFCTLTIETGLAVDQPALVQRAAELAFETVSPDVDKREPAAKLYRTLLAQLDKLPATPKGKGDKR